MKNEYNKIEYINEAKEQEVLECIYMEETGNERFPEPLPKPEERPSEKACLDEFMDLSTQVSFSTYVEAVRFEISYQHYGLSSARSLRDDKDCVKMYAWLQEHFPFPESSNLFSLSTGIVADERTSEDVLKTSTLGPQTVVVFDGYPEGTKGGTKTAERLKRSMETISADIIFDENMITTIKKETFLANTDNRKRLIPMIIAKLHSQRMTWRQATEDAGTTVYS
ncbi:hypothetical protein JTB14_018423 [Gonioctena quinquepunctata]|nr:hypothetical protein JTB14_018423 [Gonioctena quinquepunctata]